MTIALQAAYVGCIMCRRSAGSLRGNKTRCTRLFRVRADVVDDGRSEQLARRPLFPSRASSDVPERYEEAPGPLRAKVRHLLASLSNTVFA